MRIFYFWKYKKNMKTIIELLSGCEASKVIAPHIPYSEYVPLDLSISNPRIHNLTTAKEYGVFIQNHLESNNGKIAFGGYQEIRNLYQRSSVFKAENTEERNIHIGLDLWINETASVHAALGGTIHSLQNNTALGDYGPTIIIQHELEPEIYSLKGLKAFLKIAEQHNLHQFPIHIKLDTGMHRLGFEAENIQELIQTLQGNQRVAVKSILSHMATSDAEEHKAFSLSQIRLFEELSSQFIRELNIQPIRHILNTSGISNFPQGQYDMVRLGIGLYGVSNDREEQKYLENVSTLKSVISQIRTIPAGDSVGYGRRFVAEKPTRVATIPIGYADGIARLWGNGVGYVIIHNEKAILLGSVCMDMLMVDVTEIECAEGDAVIVFGESPTVMEMAQKTQTIP
jgi:alanine racemase